MATNIDELQIEINAKAQSANNAIDRLVGKLDRLSDSLVKINGTNLSGLANGVQRLGNAMQIMNTVKTADFTRLAKNLANLGNVNTQALNSAASSMSHLTRAFNNLGTVSANAQAVGDMAKNISKLGNASVQRAITNIPQLAVSLNNLMITLSQSPQVSTNVIQLTNSLAKLASQGGKVGTASRSIQSGLNRASTTATKAKKSFSGLASAFGKFYASYFLAIRGLKGLWSSIQSTADYIEAYNYFNVALGKIGSDWQEQWQKYGYENAEAYADSFATRLSESLRNLSGVSIEIGADGMGILSESGMKNLGLNIQEVTQYAAQLASVTNSVGQTGEVSLAAAEALTKLGADMSSLFNIDYSQVMGNLNSALIGQSRAVYKYGIDITNATLQTLAYELGLEKTVTEMSQMEKMQLRIISILRQSKVSWGDLANTISSPSNMIRQLTTNLKEIGLILGQLFIPLLKQALPVINGFAIAIKRLLVSVASFLGVKIDFSDFGKGYNEAEDALEGIADGYDEITEAADGASKSTRKFDELNVISTGSKASAATAGTLGSIDLTKEILAATEEYNKVWAEAFAQMENTAQKFADNIEKKLKPLEELFKDLTLGDFFKVGEDVSGIVTGITEMFSKAIEKVNWQLVGNNFGLFLAGIDWSLVFQNIGDAIFGALEGALAAWQGAFDVAPIETAIITAIGLLTWSGLGKALTLSMGNALVGGITLSELKINISSIPLSISNPVLLEVGNKILDEISKKIKELIPDWAFDLLSGIGAGITLGAVAGSWFPGVGTVAGAILGGIVGALGGLKIDGKSVLEHIADTIFNFDQTQAIFADVKKRFNEGGLNIVLGVGEGILGAVSFILEPIQDLFDFLWSGICKVFGIHSPATTMEPIGKNIVLGIKKGFVNAFKELETAVKELWNNIAVWLNDKLTFDIMGKTVELGKVPTFSTSSSKYTVNTSVPNTTIPNVGIVQNKLSNVNSINSDIQSAVYNATKRALSENNNTTNVNVTLEGDANELFRVVQGSASDYYKRTGKAAFDY